MCHPNEHLCLFMSPIHLCQSLFTSTYLCSHPVTSLYHSFCPPHLSDSLHHSLIPLRLSPSPFEVVYIFAQLFVKVKVFSLSLSFSPHQLSFIDVFLDALCFPSRSFLLHLPLSPFCSLTLPLTEPLYLHSHSGSEQK